MPLSVVDGKITGRLTGLVEVTGKLAVVQTVSGFLTNAGIIYRPIPAYEGDYVVTPKPLEEQILETKDFRMTDDVTVKEIPYAEVTNPVGGKTAIIGGI